MSTIVMDAKDEVIMKLVHYFVTEGNYNPIIVNGVKDEIWLENQDGPYRIVRINSNNIFNTEQLDYDYLKINSISKQIKKKTLSFKVNTLSILLNVNEDLKLENPKNVDYVPIYNNDLNITDERILEAFPDINEKLLTDTNGLDLIINVTQDINHKTEEDNRRFDKVFSPKKIIITPLLIAVCIIMFVLTIVLTSADSIISADPETLLRLGGNLTIYLKEGQFWRLFTYMFLHGSAMHLIINMYSLYVIGTQLETFIGKAKFSFVYVVSGICGGLLSAVATPFINPGKNIVSIGASGAIFGLVAALLYFGYHYRTYLGAALKTQLLPIIANLVIGFMTVGIDNACHIGGLIGGFLSIMIVGIDNNAKTFERISGAICLTIYIIFMYFVLMRYV